MPTSATMRIKLSLGDWNAALLQDGGRQLLLHQLRQYLHFCTSKASKLSTCSASAHQWFCFLLGDWNAALLQDGEGHLLACRCQ